jgi:hypothetical protein
MDRKLSIEAQARALSAIKELHSIVKLDFDWNEDDLKALKIGIGISIGTIEVDLLNIIYREFPDLDDLKNQIGPQTR